MRSDMEDIPEESQTPENLICCFLDRGDAGEQIIKMLAEFGFEIVKAAPPIDEAAERRAFEKRFEYSKPPNGEDYFRHPYPNYGGHTAADLAWFAWLTRARLAPDEDTAPPERKTRPAAG